jgi:hypothetical protein
MACCGPTPIGSIWSWSAFSRDPRRRDCSDRRYFLLRPFLRSAQYFFILALTAFRAAADIFRRRRPSGCLPAAEAASKPLPLPRNSGKCRKIARASSAICPRRRSAPRSAHRRRSGNSRFVLVIQVNSTPPSRPVGPHAHPILGRAIGHWHETPSQHPRSPTLQAAEEQYALALCVGSSTPRRRHRIPA